MSFVHNENEKQRLKSYRLHSVLVLATIATLTVMVSGTIPQAAAVFEVVLDNPFNCGRKYFGIKNHQNDEGSSWAFTMPTTCVGPPPFAYYGDLEAVKLHSAITRNNATQWDIAWEAAIQSTNPWKPWAAGADDTMPTTNNPNFLHDSTKFYNLQAKWVWTNDALPTNSNVRSFYLADLWFVNPTNGKRLVIDFMIDWLVYDSTNGKWKQQSAGGTGGFYFTPFCKKIDGIDTYHYNVVIHDGTTTAGTWNTVNTNINDEINNAFSHTYGTGGGGPACTSSTTGGRSAYKVAALEAGIEVQATALGGKGKSEGGYSIARLYY